MRRGAIAMRRRLLLVLCALLGAAAGASLAGAADRSRAKPAAKVDLIRAQWPYAPPAAAPVPGVKTPGWCRNPIDRFILAKLEARGLKPAPPANPVTLLRRLYADLI